MTDVMSIRWKEDDSQITARRQFWLQPDNSRITVVITVGWKTDDRYDENQMIFVYKSYDWQIKVKWKPN